MKNLKNRAILAAVAVAVGVVFALKYKSSPAPEPTPGNEVASGLPRLLELGADKCTSCKLMAPIIADLQRTYAGQMQVDFIDVWQDEDAGERYEARFIPLQIFFDAEGQELFRHQGFYPKDDILAKWKELGYEFQ